MLGVFGVRTRLRKGKEAVRRVEWLDAKGKSLGHGTIPWVAPRKGEERRRYLGVKNTGTEPLRRLVLTSSPNQLSVATFSRPGRCKKFMPTLALGDLLPGRRVMFWVREVATGAQMEGACAEIRVEES